MNQHLSQNINQTKCQLCRQELRKSIGSYSKLLILKCSSIICKYVVYEDDWHADIFDWNAIPWEEAV